MDIKLLGYFTEEQIKETAKVLEVKAKFDMYAELYKLGMISKEKFIEYARHYIAFNPDEYISKELP